MPVRIPAKPKEPDAPKAEWIERKDVIALLDERDTAWKAAIDAEIKRIELKLKADIATAIAGIRPTPKKGARITFKYDHQGSVTSAEIEPKT